MIEISKLLTQFFQGMKSRRRAVWIALYALMLIIFLEAASALVFNTMVSPEKLHRLYLGWVGPQYLREQGRYLKHLAENNRTDTIYIAALGGSTTETGYPAYTERYLNDKLERAKSSLRVKVFNFGVSGWNSQNSLLNYVYLVRYLSPEYVIFHHNANEFFFNEERRRQSVLYLPHAGHTERAMLRSSEFYKLVEFTYFLSHNHLVYGTGVVQSKNPNISMHTLISTYLNKEGGVSPRDVFQRDFAGNQPRLPTEIENNLLTETHKTLIQYACADGSTLIMTTQYLNVTKTDPNGLPPLTQNQQVTDERNQIIKDIATELDVPLVDLDKYMKEYDYLLLDGLHFMDEGIKIKGELVGEGIWELIQAEHKDD